MCMECEKNIFVKCIKSVSCEKEGIEIFTEGKEYGAFTWYHDADGLHFLTAMANNQEEATIAEAVEDNIEEYLKDECFLEHFKLTKYYQI